MCPRIGLFVSCRQRVDKGSISPQAAHNSSLSKIWPLKYKGELHLFTWQSLHSNKWLEWMTRALVNTNMYTIREFELSIEVHFIEAVWNTNVSPPSVDCSAHRTKNKYPGTRHTLTLTENYTEYVLAKYLQEFKFARGCVVSELQSTNGHLPNPSYSTWQRYRYTSQHCR